MEPRFQYAELFKFIIFKKCLVFCYYVKCVGFFQYVGRVAQSVYPLATGSTVRGSNPGAGRGFLHLYRPAMGPTQPPVQWVPGLSRG